MKAYVIAYGLKLAGFPRPTRGAFGSSKLVNHVHLGSVCVEKDYGWIYVSYLPDTPIRVGRMLIQPVLCLKTLPPFTEFVYIHPLLRCCTAGARLVAVQYFADPPPKLATKIKKWTRKFINHVLGTGYRGVAELLSDPDRDVEGAWMDGRRVEYAEAASTCSFRWMVVSFRDIAVVLWS